MGNWIYLFKVSGLLILFWLVYTLLLQKESFKVFNRFYLLLGIAFSFGLPLYVFTEIEVIVIPETTYEPLSIPFNFTSDQVSVALKESFNPLQLVGYVYWIGVFFMSTKLVMQLFMLVKLMRQCKKVVIDGISHYQSPTPIASFSFLNSIFYHIESQDEKSLNLILTHEKEHISQKHSFDLLIANFLPVFLWFLPFAYAYRRAINENLEFLADASTLAKIEDKKQYQYTLLNATGVPQPKLVANFFFTHSSLKKRIMHINQSPSAAINKLKSLLILPFLFGFIYLFQTETQAMYVTEATPKEPSLNYQDETQVYKDTSFVVSVQFNSIEDTITKDTTDEELDEIVKYFKESMDIDVKISKLKRNKKGEITRIHIKLEDKSANLKSEQKIQSSSGIDPILVYRKKDETTDILAIAFDEVTTEINTSKFVGTKKLSEILKDKEVVYFNGKKLDLDKSNVFTSYKMQNENETSIYLIGDFVGSFENLREVLEKTESNASVYVASNSVVGSKDEGSPIKIIHIKKNMSFEGTNDINASENKINVEKSKSNLNETVINFESTYEQNDVLYEINGKVVDHEVIREIDPNTIESVEVIKDKEKVNAYTDKDVSGIIKIKLKADSISPVPPSPSLLFDMEDVDMEDDIEDWVLEGDKSLIKADEVEFGAMKINSSSSVDLTKNKGNLFFLKRKKNERQRSRCTF